MLRTSLIALATMAMGTQAVADQFESCRASSIAGDAAIGGPFELIDETGATVTDADVITEPTLLYFGYTFCPDVCPLDAARNGVAVDILADEGYSATPVFITVDPARDNAELLAEWTDLLHPEMIGLTGSEDQIRAAAQAYRAFYRAQRSGDEFYLVDHSSFTYLVLPEVGFVEFFRSGATAEEIAETAACYIENA